MNEFAFKMNTIYFYSFRLGDYYNVVRLPSLPSSKSSIYSRGFFGGGGGLKPNFKHFVSPNIAVQNLNSVYFMFYSDSIISGLIVRQMFGCSRSNFRKPQGRGLWTLILWNRCAGDLYVSKIWISDIVCKSNNNIKLASRILFFDPQT